jgi:hypothetical protein
MDNQQLVKLLMQLKNTKIMKIKYIWLFFILIGFAACNDDNDSSMIDDKVELKAGSADFSTYVAIGDSEVAGYTDGALFVVGQENSMSNMLAQQFSLIGGGDFTQPLMNDNIGGLLFNGTQILSSRYYFDGSGPALLPAAPTTEVLNHLSGSYKNMGIPGLKSFHMLAEGYGNPAGVPLGLANPYFARFASSPATSVLADVLSQNPSFFSLWVGGDDVLFYALNGGDGVNQLGNYDPSTYGLNDITDPNVFAQVYSAAVTALTSNGAKGVVLNIPYITDLPHFTTVTYNPLDPSNPAFGPLIPTLNMVYGAINQVYDAIGQPNRKVVFSETAASAVVVVDESLTDVSAIITGALLASPQFPAFLAQLGLPEQAAPLVANLLGITYGQSRQATASDLLVLPSMNVIGTVNQDRANYLVSQGLSQALADQFSTEGVTLPLENKWVLIPSEQQDIKEAIDSYNQTIFDVAVANNLALVDIKSLFERLTSTGIVTGNYILNDGLVTGGAISLDGIHTTARGNTLIVNEILTDIDGAFGSNFREAGALKDGGDYPTNYNPALQ